MTTSPLFAHTLVLLNLALACVTVAGCIYLRDYLIRTLEPYVRIGVLPRWLAAVWPLACVGLAAVTLLQLALPLGSVPNVPVLRAGIAAFFAAFLLVRHRLVSGGQIPPLDCDRLRRLTRRGPAEAA